MAVDTRPIPPYQFWEHYEFLKSYLSLGEAQVAELVDALASGASDLLVVEVRVFSWAPALRFKC